jgi:hypothetical protein
MKKFLILLLPLLVSCSTIQDSFLMTKFDPNEYQIITTIRVNAIQYKNSCNDSKLSQVNAINMAYQTNLFEKYSEHLSHNGDSYNTSKLLNEIAQGLANRYNTENQVSNVFCQLKFESIANSANLIQHILGNRPR